MTFLPEAQKNGVVFQLDKNTINVLYFVKVEYKLVFELTKQSIKVFYRAQRKLDIVGSIIHCKAKSKHLEFISHIYDSWISK